MGRAEKLLKIIETKPKNFKWNDVITLLSSLGYEQLKGDGSRRKFYHRKTENVLILHEPHPEKEIKSYAVKLIINSLKEIGAIDGTF